MIFDKLYKYTTIGQIQEWQIFCPPGENYYYTVEGISGGKMTTSDPTYCEGKNKGKKNETSDEEQALLEAKSKYRAKLASGYHPDVNKSGAQFFQPMLAKDLDDNTKKLLFKNRTFIQPKLDGIRCIINNGKLWTRTGKEIVSCDHLSIYNYLLDGELYNHDLRHDFDKIVSIVRKTKLTTEDKYEAIDNIQYWIYDFPAYKDLPFSKRFEILKQHFDRKEFHDKFKLVLTYEVTSFDEIQKYHEEFIRLGFEGSIIRIDSTGYENKRSKSLLKYKNWMEEDFPILEVLEGQGNRSECANMLVLQLPNGETSKATVTGSEEFMKRLWQERRSIIGKLASTKFFSYTDEGKLRFPTIKTIRDYE